MRHSALALLIGLLLTACGTPTSGNQATGRSDGAHDAHGDHPQIDVQLTDWTGEARTVTARVVNGKLLHEHDILLGHVTSAKSSGAAGEGRVEALATPVTKTHRWPSGVIPYTFHPDVPATVRNQVMKAIETFDRNTNVRWVPRTTEVYYTQFIVDSGCYSYVGRSSILRQPQPISLGRGECGLSGAIHEMAHAAGLYHEQSRPDRDQYVRILWENIPPEWHSQYQHGRKSTAHGAYNYTSIMHYPAYFKGKLAIQPLDPNVNPSTLGSARTLSQGDIDGLNSLYP